MWILTLGPSVGRIFDSRTFDRPTIRKAKCSIYLIVEQYIWILYWAWIPSVGRIFDWRTFDRPSIRNARCSIYLIVEQYIWIFYWAWSPSVGRTFDEKRDFIEETEKAEQKDDLDSKENRYCDLEREDHSYTPNSEWSCRQDFEILHCVFFFFPCT